MNPRAILRVAPPDLREERGDALLLVWGGLAQWLVVDRELAAFIDLFDGRRTAGEAIAMHARRLKKPRKLVEKEAESIVRTLLDRGILAKKNAPEQPVPPDNSIANVTLNITNRCNLKCTFCYNAEREGDEIPADRLMNELSAAKEVFEKNASLIILGGEPLMVRERLFRILDRAGEVFDSTPMISTNGTLLRPSLVVELARHNIDVQVSLDSHDAERHDAMRGRDVFAQVIDGVRRLVDAGLKPTLCMVYAQDNFRDFEPYLDLALQLGAKEVRFIPLRMIGGGLTTERRAPNQLEAFGRLVGILERRPELGRLLQRDYFSICLNILRLSGRRTSCGVGGKVIFIDADGKVYPCPNHVGEAWLCGNLRQRGLAEIISRSPVLAAMRERMHVARYPSCVSCPFRFWCAGDCRGEVIACTGDETAPSPHCEELQEMFVQMLWLLASGKASLFASLPSADAPRPAANSLF